MESLVDIQFIARGSDGKTYTNTDLGGCLEIYYIIPTKQQVIEDMELALYYLQEDTPQEVIFTTCECHIVKGQKLMIESGLQQEYRLLATPEE